MYTQYRGFTLIELIIVIVLLGILSAVALPRFLDLSTDARRSVNQGIVGSLASSSAAFSARSQMPADTTSPTISKKPTIFSSVKAIDMDPGAATGIYLWFSNNYPVGGGFAAARTKGIITTATNDGLIDSTTTYQQGCTNIFNGLLSDSSTKTGNGSTTAAASGTAILGTGTAINTLPYTTAASGSSVLPTNNVNNNTSLKVSAYQAGSTADGTTTPASGGCLYVNTSSIGSTTVFYIWYNAVNGQFTAIESAT